MIRRLRFFIAALVVGGGAAVLPTATSLALGVTNYALISIAPNGTPADQNSTAPVMTPDGRYVAFESYATNLTNTPLPSPFQVYLYDRQTHTMEIVSRTSTGDLAQSQSVQVLGISDDGRYVTFRDTAANLPGGNGIYLRDRQAGTTERLADGASFHSVSANAAVFALFNISGSSTTGFIYNRTTGQTITMPAGAADLTVSADGQYAAYYIYQNGTNTAYRYTIATGDTVSLGTNPFAVALSPDGSHALLYDTNAAGNFDVEYETVATGQRRALFQDSRGAGEGGLTFDRQGSRVAYLVSTDPASPFTSDEARVTDLTTNQTVVVDNGLHHQGFLSLSGDGTQLAFNSATRQTGSAGTQEIYVAQLGDDTSPPTVTGIPDRPANTNGWYNNDVTITWHATDDSGSATQPPATAASTEGAQVTYTSGQSCDPSGNCATGSLDLNIDKTAPTVGAPSASPRLILFTGTMTIGANANDTLSGVTGGEYYIDIDPGRGNGVPMAFNAGTGRISATKSFSSGSLTPGQHTLYMRSQDAAGNWSSPASITFVYI